MIHRSSIFALALVTIASAAVAGCNPSYRALTVPPPFVEAELCDGTESCGGGQTIKLTKGIALAFECVSRQGTPCENATATMADGEIATILPGYLDTLSPPVYSGGYSSAGSRPRTAFVVVGRSVGTTTLTVHSNEGSTDFEVTIPDL